MRCVVMDNGTGYTKMGFGGNLKPAFDIPTLISENLLPGANVLNSNRKTNSTLDFFIGDEVSLRSKDQKTTNPIRSGIVQDWDLMERFWHRCIHDYLRCDPEDTVFILTEPPLNPPENREHEAEIMFQTFNVEGLHIGVQAVLALISSSGISEKSTGVSLTGTVVDAGDGVTHVIPISDGYVIGSCIKHIPLAGSNITSMISNMIQERREKLPVEELSKVSRAIKQKFGYVVEDGNLVQEFKNYDNRMNNEKLMKKFDKYVAGKDEITKEEYRVRVGYERFLAPEMFFHPEIVDPKYKQPLDEIVDNAIQFSPIHMRTSLYSNIVLSGGSTLFPGLIPRLQKGVENRVNSRLKKFNKDTHMDVIVQENIYQRYAVWQGGSILSTMPGFAKMYHTRQQYFQHGSSIARHNAVFMG